MYLCMYVCKQGFPCDICLHGKTITFSLTKISIPSQNPVLTLRIRICPSAPDGETAQLFALNMSLLEVIAHFNVIECMS